MNFERVMSEHPCFSCSARKYYRLHLPVAPKCNVQCRYCNRKFDCASENRPGVTSSVLSPDEAVDLYEKNRNLTGLKVVGISGPGDPLANFDVVREVFRRIREIDRNVILCLSTNGLYLPEYIDELTDIGINSISVTVNAVTVETALKIYSACDGEKVNHKNIETLLSRQWEGIARAAEKGVCCKINTVLLNTVNLHEIEKIAEKAAACGAVIHNLIPLIPVAETQFDSSFVPSAEQIEKLHGNCSKHIEQMMHCKRCRADAFGDLL